MTRPAAIILRLPRPYRPARVIRERIGFAIRWYGIAWARAYR